MRGNIPELSRPSLLSSLSPAEDFILGVRPLCVMFTRANLHLGFFFRNIPKPSAQKCTCGMTNEQQHFEEERRPLPSFLIRPEETGCIKPLFSVLYSPSAFSNLSSSVTD